MASWDFSKLPLDQHQRTIEAFNNANVAELIIIHDLYQLSPHAYCCGRDAKKSVYDWFGWAIENGLVYEQKE